jgi:hypothetical protein
MRRSAATLGFAIIVLILCPAGSLRAASHLWKIHEVFSDAEGKVQYIVLHECCGATQELYLKNLLVTSEATGKAFAFPRDLTGSSARKWLLLATAAFGAIPGAPAPDFILPDGFFSPQGDTIWYSEARNYDSFTFRAGDLPVDGLHALRITDYAADRFEVATNAPINYAGVSGTIEAGDPPFRRADCNDDGSPNISDAIFLLNGLFVAPAPLSCRDACDANDDGEVDISDALALLIALFEAAAALPPPSGCGGDPTPDEIGCATSTSCA